MHAAPQTVINIPMRLNEFSRLPHRPPSARCDRRQQTGITDGQQSRLVDLGERWQAQQKAVASTLGEAVDGFNELVWARTIPPIVVRR